MRTRASSCGSAAGCRWCSSSGAPSVQLSLLEATDARIARCCCRLAVLPEDTEMPLSVTAMLWGVDDVDAATIARKLEGQNLVKRTEAGGRTALGKYQVVSVSDVCRSLQVVTVSVSRDVV
mmetsp:Transcript_22488/g.66615  ORF Transcript_22488/g.66615 Transcript_22488/m.66615 type:complete len:121 (-) Transcript_22488:90-452(-)